MNCFCVFDRVPDGQLMTRTERRRWLRSASMYILPLLNFIFHRSLVRLHVQCACSGEASTRLTTIQTYGFRRALYGNAYRSSFMLFLDSLGTSGSSLYGCDDRIHKRNTKMQYPPTALVRACNRIQPRFICKIILQTIVVAWFVASCVDFRVTVALREEQKASWSAV
jgi:hypothetical protein